MYQKLKISKLSLDYILKPFDCGDTDLNDFFLNDALNYQNQLLAVTYVVEDLVQHEIVAFFFIAPR